MENSRSLIDLYVPVVGVVQVSDRCTGLFSLPLLLLLGHICSNRTFCSRCMSTGETWSRHLCPQCYGDAEKTAFKTSVHFRTEPQEKLVFWTSIESEKRSIHSRCLHTPRRFGMHGRQASFHFAGDQSPVAALRNLSARTLFHRTKTAI